jgi:hypothetical protein
MKVSERKKIGDHSSASGARELADRIVAFWKARGFAIEATVTVVTRRGTGDAELIYGVRTNLHNGLPPRESRIDASEPLKLAA